MEMGFVVGEYCDMFKIRKIIKTTNMLTFITPHEFPVSKHIE